MKQVLHSVKGVTILEGVIALGLLAVVTAGAYAVLLSTSRGTSKPDMREEMMLAIENANDQLKVYTHLGGSSTTGFPFTSGFSNGLCGSVTGTSQTVDTQPLNTGVHTIKCLLPPSCDRNQSDFTYTVTTHTVGLPLADAQWETGGESQNIYQIQFNIVCNGYKL